MTLIPLIICVNNNFSSSDSFLNSAIAFVLWSVSNLQCHVRTIRVSQDWEAAENNHRGLTYFNMANIMQSNNEGESRILQYFQPCRTALRANSIEQQKAVV